MKYAPYSTEDFLADESFQAYVLESDSAAVEFWRQWVILHPAQAPEFYEAENLLQQLIGQRKQVSELVKREEVAKLWRSMRPPVAPRAQPALRVERRARRWAGALTSLVVIMLVGLGLSQRSATTIWTSYATRGGEHRQLLLPDGSSVMLNANSVLKLATTWQPGQPREVWLKGEAFFDVRHTAPAQLKAVAAAPANVKFTVHAGPLDVAVLGTQFDVLNRPGKTKVMLKSGQVQLSHQQAGRTEQLLLKPGELAEFRPATPQATLAKRAVNPTFYSAWTIGHLDFQNTPVAEIIPLLEDTYGLKITVRNPALLRQKLTGSVPNHDVDVLLNAFSKSLDVSARREGTHVWLE